MLMHRPILAVVYDSNDPQQFGCPLGEVDAFVDYTGRVSVDVKEH